MKIYLVSAAVLSAQLANASVVSRAAPIDALVGFGVGTTGGGNASPITVTTCDALKTAGASEAPAVIRITTTLSGCGMIDIKSNKTIIGVGTSGGFSGSGLRVRRSQNVIIRNLKFNVPPAKGDALGLDHAVNVWVDHNEFLSKGRVGDKDDYDGLLDITNASDLVTVSWNTFRDHWKGSLVGNSGDNGDEDKGHLRVTYHHNLFSNVSSRLPSLRFGTAHIYNNVYKDIPISAINSRMGANALVESNIFNNVQLAIVTDLDSAEEGFATDKNNVKTSSTTRITQTSSWMPSYSFQLDSTSSLESIINTSAGIGKIA